MIHTILSYFILSTWTTCEDLETAYEDNNCCEPTPQIKTLTKYENVFGPRVVSLTSVWEAEFISQPDMS